MSGPSQPLDGLDDEIGVELHMTSPIDLAALLDELSDGVFLCAKTGEILYSNPALARILGITSRKLEDMNLARDFVDRELEWKALVSLLEQGGIIQDYELRLKRKDGTMVHSSVTVSNLRDEAGTLIGLAGILRDITTRKGIEIELREKAFRIDVMNKIAKMASAETDIRKHVLVSMAEELRKLVSFDKLLIAITEDNGRHVQVIIPSTDSPTASKTLGTVPFDGSLVEKLKFGRKPIVLEKDAGKKQFSELAIADSAGMQSMACVALTSRGRVIGAISIYSARPKEYGIESVDSLQMVADQIAGLIDNMSLMSSLQNKIALQDALVRTGVEVQRAINTEQIYATISHGMKEIVDYTDLSFYLVDLQKRLIYPVFAVGPWANEVMAAPGSIDEGLVGAVAKTGRAEFTDDIDADPRSADIPGIPLEHNSMLALPLTVGEGVIGVLEVYRPRGQVFTIGDFEAAQLFAQQASIALANAQLVSKLQEAKNEIEMLNDLMFHDINNFNFATMNYIQMIAASETTPPLQKVQLEKSLRLIRQTAELIGNVKKLTKIGVMNPADFAPVDLHRVLSKVASGLESSFPTRSVSIKVDLEEPSFVLGNDLIEELFVNLLSNSVKYDPHEQVEIDISCEKVLEDSRPMWRVCVSDHGSGIPDDKKALLFQRHVRLKPDTAAGAGLGLSICRALTDKFGGRVWVEDRVPGQSELGAKFCVILPASKPPEAQS